MDTNQCVLSFKTYLGKDAVHHFINNMINKTKYCCDVMKKHFSKELAMKEERRQ